MAAGAPQPEQVHADVELREAVSGDAAPPFVCPACRAPLEHHTGANEHYRCSACARSYPVVIGIPDFRLRPDPWIGLEADREKGIALEAETLDADFETTVRAYWARTPGTPREQADRFTQFVVSAEPRAAEWLAGVAPSESSRGWWLDVGCGTADMVLAGVRVGQRMIGIDIAFRWLVVARRRLQRAGVAAPLVCCNAEHLPFPDARFRRVVSLGTLEHCLDADAMVSEAARVLEPGGRLHLRTVNRYSLLREPHVGVWGVGFVPRRWADAYVHWRSGQRYEHHRPLSSRELRRFARASGLRDVRLGAAALLAADRARLGRLAAVAPLYEAARLAPAIGRAVSWGAPLLQLDAVRPPAHGT
jgi:LSD1 subclass zinc finger protein